MLSQNWMIHFPICTQRRLQIFQQWQFISLFWTDAELFTTFWLAWLTESIIYKSLPSNCQPSFWVERVKLYLKKIWNTHTQKMFFPPKYYKLFLGGGMGMRLKDQKVSIDPAKPAFCWVTQQVMVCFSLLLLHLGIWRKII